MFMQNGGFRLGDEVHVIMKTGGCPGIIGYSIVTGIVCHINPRSGHEQLVVYRAYDRSSLHEFEAEPEDVYLSRDLAIDNLTKLLISQKGDV